MLNKFSVATAQTQLSMALVANKFSASLSWKKSEEKIAKNSAQTHILQLRYTGKLLNKK